VAERIASSLGLSLQFFAFEETVSADYQMPLSACGAVHPRRDTGIVLAPVHELLRRHWPQPIFTGTLLSGHENRTSRSFARSVVLVWSIRVRPSRAEHTRRVKHRCDIAKIT
jgi:hypothetical protein